MSAADAPTGADRILTAAIDLFGRFGVAGTSLRQIAADAGVSQALVVHHFGSKVGLRRACDRHVAAVTRSTKETGLGRGSRLDPFAALRQIEQSRPLLRYLARALTDGGDQATELVDEFVTDAEEYLHEAEQAGFVKPSCTPRDRAVVLVILSMGALAMHDHLHRLLGVDLLDEHAPPESLGRYLRPMIELYSQGLLEDGAFDQLVRLFDGAESLPTDLTTR